VSLSVVEYAVKDDEGDARSTLVKNYGNSVRITWLCGDARTFSKETLPTLVYAVDAMAKTGSEELTFFKDSNGYKVYVLLMDGTLYADTHTFEVSDASVGVPWADLKKAIKKILEV
jgi:hypothetical protein